nr:Ig-like domain-containing protein [Cobetia sp. AM6]
MPYANQSASDGDSFALGTADVFGDLDNYDDLTYTVSGLPEGLSIDAETGEITGTLTADSSANGPYAITVVGTDSQGNQVSDTFDLAVNNPAPVAGADAVSVDEKAPASGNVLANDNDGLNDTDALVVSQVGEDAANVGQPTAGDNGGQFTVNADGSYDFAPGADFDDLAADETRTTTISYQVSDGQGGFDTSTVSVTVNGANDAPVVSAPTDDLSANDADEIDIPAGDAFSDVDASDVLSFTATGLPAGLSINQTTGRITGTLASDASQNGPFNIVVTADDGNGGTVTDTILLEVSNISPEANPDQKTTDENALAVGNVLLNDTSGDNDALVVSQVNGDSAGVGQAIAGTQGGEFTVSEDGSYAFIPGADFDDLAVDETRTTTISYQVSDGQGGVDTATLSVTVTGSNDAPVVSTPTADASAEDGDAIDIPAGDAFSDVDDSDDLTFTAAGLPEGVTIDPDTGRITGTLTPDASQNGPFEITVTADDGNGGTVTDTFTLTPSNTAPVAQDDAVTVAEKAPASGNVLDNDVDGGNDTDSLNVSQVGEDAANVGQPTAGDNGGQFTVNADGSYDFAPGADFDDLAVDETRTTTISYQVSDGQGGVDTATLSVTVTGTNDAPVVSTPTVDASAEDGDAIDIPAGDAFSDVDGSDDLTFTAAGLPEGVTIDPDTGRITGTLTPDASQNGPFEITVTADDGNGGTVTDTFTLTPSNTAPVAQDDAVTVAEKAPASGNVLDNDVDGGNDTDSLNVSQVGEDAANVGQPTAGDNGGQFTVNADGSYDFAPGADFDDLAVGEERTTTVSYQVSDGQGGVDTATLSVTVTGSNDVPVVSTPTADASAEDGDAIDIPAGDAFSDVDDSDDLTFTAAGLPEGVTIDPDTGRITGTLTPDASQNGPFEITVTADDGNGGTVTDTFTLTPSNTAPVAQDDAVTVAEKAPASGNVLDNDVDGGNDTDSLNVSQVGEDAANVGQPTVGDNGGQFTVNADGSYDFAPGADFDDLAVDETRTTTISYQVSDGQGGVDTATLSVTVTGTNDAPVVSTPTVDASAEDGDAIDIPAGDAFSDVDGSDDLTFTAAGLPEGVTIDPDTGRITGTLTPDASQNGPFEITVTADDGNGGTVIDTFTLTPSNTAPVAQDDAATVAEKAPASGNVLDNDADGGNDTDTLNVSQVGEDAANVGQPTAGDNGGQFTVNADGSYDFAPGADFDGLAVDETRTTTISYQVSDGQGGVDTATLSVTVTGTNDAPVVSTPTADASAEDGDAIDIPAGDAFSDVDDSDDLTFTAAGLPEGVTIDPDTGRITGTLTPDASQNGPFEITVTADDGNGGTVTDTFTLTPSNTAPVAQDDAVTVAEKAPASGNVLDNDVDGGNDTDSLNVSQVGEDAANVGQPTAGDNGGQFTVNADGSYDFAPGADFDDLAVGEERTTTVSYQVSDGQGGVDTATLSVTVTGSNDVPVVSTPTADASAEDGDAIDIPAGDAFSDVDDSDDLTFTAAGLPEGVTIDPDTGRITGTLTPDASQNGPFEITVTADDGNGGTVTDTFTLTPSNTAPVAQDDAATVAEKAPASGNVLDNDADGGNDTDTLNVSQVGEDAANVGQPTAGDNGGQFTVNADGSYDFAPGADFDDLAVDETRTTTISYQVSDGQGGVDTATLSVTVTGTNDAPVVSTPTADASAEDGDAIDIPAGDAFSDVDDSDGLTFTAAGLPEGVTIDPDTGRITGTLTPDASQNGPFEITVTADDGNGGTVTDTFILTSGNTAPVAQDDAATVAEKAPASGNVLDNDADGGNDTDTLNVSQVGEDAANVGQPTAGDNGGQFTVNADGSYDFAPGADFDDLAVDETRTTTISYQVSDGQGGVDTATLSVTVTGTNDAPVVSTPTADASAEDGDAIDIPAGDAFSDVDDSDDLTFTAAGLPEGVTIDPDTGRITGTLTPDASQNGPFEITVTADDGNGGTVTDTFILTPSNTAPVAQDDQRETAENIVAIGNVLMNDTDGGNDSDDLGVSQINGSAADIGQPVEGNNGGQFTIGVDGGYAFNPGGDFDDLAVNETRTTTVSYQVSDGQGGVDTATLSITVTGTNVAPVAVADTNVTTENSSVSGDVLLNDSDVDASDILSVSQVGEDAANVGQPTAGDNGGQFTVNADGSYDFAPGADFDDLAVGEERTTTVSYQVSDGQGGVDTATLSVTVTGSNDAPVVSTPTADASAEDGDAIDIPAGDAFSDVDGSDDLTFTAAGLPEGVTIDPDTGRITGTLTPDASQNGPFEITVTADDGNGGTVTDTFTLTPSNTAPVAQDDAVTVAEKAPASGNVLDNDVDGGNDTDTLNVSQVGEDAANVGQPTAGDNGGQFTVNADGSYDFAPGADFDDLAVGEERTTTVSYQVSDGQGGVDTATLSVTVTGSNDAPVVSTPTADASAEDGDAIDIPAGDAFSDVDGSDDLTFTAAGLPEGVTIDPDTGRITGTLTPDASQNGPFEITVTADDGNGGTVTDTFTLTPSNTAPVAQDDAVTVAEKAPASGNVLDNDVDGGNDTDSLNVSQVGEDAANVGQPTAGDNGGQFTVNADGSYDFAPGADFDDLAVGEERTTTVSYQVSDGQGGVDTATLSVTVTGTNDAPVVSTPTADASAEDGDAIDIPAGDAFSDVDGSDDLIFTAAGLPEGVTIDPDTGRITGTLTPDASQNGPFEITVTADDGNGGTVTDTFILTSSNTAPVAQDDAATVAEKAPASGNVLDNDVDGGNDTDTLNVSQVGEDAANVGQPTAGDNGGQFTVNADGSYDFAPGADFDDLAVGEERTTTVSYQVSDGQGGVDTAILSVTVTGTNDAPVVSTPTADASAEDGDAIDIPAGDAFSDVDDSDDLTFTAAGLPDGVAIDPDTGRITGTLTPNASQNGPFEITVTADDGNGGTVTDTFTLTPSNTAPVAQDDAATVAEKAPASGNVLDNDVDGGNDTDSLNVSQVGEDAANVGQPTAGDNGGQFTVNADGSYDFAPGADFDDLAVDETRTTTISYQVSDGQGGVDTATLSVTVTGTNDAPVAMADTNVTTENSSVSGDILLNDSDVDASDILSVSQVGEDAANVGQPTAGDNGGQFTVNADGSYDFAPGADFDDLAVGEERTTTVSYQVSDGQGGVDTATLSVTVTGTNDAPVVSTPTADASAEDGDAIDIPAGDAFSDVDDSDDLTFTAAGLPEGVTIDPDTGRITGTLTPDASQNGPFEITVTADDGNGGTVTDTFTLTPSNTAPVAQDDAVTVAEKAPASGNVLGNDVDGGNDTDTLSVSQVGEDAANVGQPTAGDNGGQFTVNADGSYDFAPGADFDDLAVDETRTTTISYQVSDGQGGVDTATLSVTVTGTNDAPVAMADTNVTTENSSVSGDVLLNDSDVDASDILSVSQVGEDAANVGQPTAGDNGGQFTVNADGSYDFAPGADFDDLAVGEERTTTVSYQVSDGQGGVDTATLSVTVTGTNDAPVVSTPTADASAEDGDAIDIPAGDAFSDVDDSDDLTFTAAGLPDGVAIDPDTGRITGTLTPNASQNGPFEITVTADDGNGGTVTDTFTLTPSNTAPVAQDDAATVAEKAPASGNVLDNDVDGGNDTDTLNVSQVGEDAANVGQPTAGDNGGQFTVNADGSYDFAPGADFDDLAVGEERTTTVSYQVSDGQGGVDTATLSVTVTGSNDVPVVSTPTADASAEDGDAIDIPAGDAFSDVDDSDDLTFTAAGLPEGVTIDPDTGRITGTLTPDASQNGPFEITVTADDGNGGTVTDTFTLTPSNTAPVAQDDAVTVAEKAPASGNVLGNDVDGGNDTDTLSVSQVGEDAANVGLPTAGDNGGQFTVNVDGSYDFAPGADFDDLAVDETRTTTISYQVSDGQGGVDTATLSVTVTGTDDAPVVVSEIPDRAVGNGGDVSIPAGEAFADTDASDELTYSATGLPDGLVIDPSTGQITGQLALDASLNAPYAITVTADDGNGGTVSYRFTLSVPSEPLALPNSTQAPSTFVPDNRVTAPYANQVLDADGLGTDGLDADTDQGQGSGNDIGNLDNFLRAGVDNGLNDLGQFGLPEAMTVRYQGTQTDGSPLPGTLAVDGSSGQLSGKLPPGMDRARITVIGVDEYGNTKTREVLVDADGNVLEEHEDQVLYRRLDVSIDSQGSAEIVHEENTGNDMQIDRMSLTGTQLSILVNDPRAAGVSRYEGSLGDGSVLPDGLTIDPETGDITGDIAGLEHSLNVRIVAVSGDGTVRILSLDIALPAEVDTAGARWQSLDQQAEDALAEVGDNRQEESLANRLARMLQLS